MIPKDIIEKINQATRIEEVIGDYVVLKKRGSNLAGICPFHPSNVPALIVSPGKGIYKCFGCGKGGNSVNFLIEHKKMTYPEALKYLATKYKILIPDDKSGA